MIQNFISIVNTNLEVFEAGSGKPLMFLHGGQGLVSSDPFLKLLSEKHKVVAPSHPGFGKSDLPEWLDAVDDIAHIYLEFMDRKSFGQVDLVGCSIGGWIAAEMATKAPERFRRVVLAAPIGVKVGPSNKLDIPDIFAMPESSVQQLLYHSPEKAHVDVDAMSDDELAIRVRNRQTLAFLTWEPWMHNPKLKHRLGRVTSPVLFLRGESDGLVSAEYVKAYASLFPNSSSDSIQEAGHALSFEQPAAFAAKVISFLND